MKKEIYVFSWNKYMMKKHFTVILSGIDKIGGVIAYVIINGILPPPPSNISPSEYSQVRPELYNFPEHIRYQTKILFEYALS